MAGKENKEMEEAFADLEAVGTPQDDINSEEADETFQATEFPPISDKETYTKEEEQSNFLQTLHKFFSDFEQKQEETRIRHREEMEEFLRIQEEERVRLAREREEERLRLAKEREDAHKKRQQEEKLQAEASKEFYVTLTSLISNISGRSPPRVSLSNKIQETPVSGGSKQTAPEAKKLQYADSTVQFKEMTPQFQKQQDVINKLMDVANGFEEKGAKPIVKKNTYPPEGQKGDLPYPSSSTPVQDGFAAADYVTQPAVSPIPHGLTLPTEGASTIPANKAAQPRDRSRSTQRNRTGSKATLGQHAPQPHGEQNPDYIPSLGRYAPPSHTEQNYDYNRTLGPPSSQSDPPTLVTPMVQNDSASLTQKVGTPGTTTMLGHSAPQPAIPSNAGTTEPPRRTNSQDRQTSGSEDQGQQRGRRRERDRKYFGSSDDESLEREYTRWSNSARARSRSRSPQQPKMPQFSGSGKPTFEAFMFQFERTAGRRGWTGDTKACKLLDCLTESALEYARKVYREHMDYNALRNDLRRRFSTKEAPVLARRQLQFIRQQENELLEEFSQRVYFTALDGYDRANSEVVEQIATEAFLRGCKDKDAARSVLEKNPVSINQAMKMVKTYMANQRAIFGVRSGHSYAHRQVTFSDRDSTPERDNPSKKEPKVSLEDEVKNLIGAVTKLSIIVGDKLAPVGRGSAPPYNRFRSPTPPAGFQRRDQGQYRARSPSPGNRSPNRRGSNSPFRQPNQPNDNLNKNGSSPAANAWPSQRE